MRPTSDPYKAMADDIRARQRKLSPHFPTAEAARLRLYNRRSKIAARLCLIGVGVGVTMILIDWRMALGLVLSAVCGISFLVICIAGGERNSTEVRP